MVKIRDDDIKKVPILMHGKSLTLPQSTRKEITKLVIITDQFYFFLFLVRFLRKSYRFNYIFGYLQESLLCDNQLGFRPSDSCEYEVKSSQVKLYF